MKKVMPKKVTPIAKAGKEPMVLPNYSGVKHHLPTVAAFDTIYLKLDGANTPTANYSWTIDLTTTGTVDAGEIKCTNDLLFDGSSVSVGFSYTNAIKFPEGSLISEQTTVGGGIDRMLWLPNGARIDVLNEAGVTYESTLKAGNFHHIRDGNTGRSIYGFGSDAYIEYDGTNMNINPKNVGSGVLSIKGEVEAGGTTSKIKLTALGGYAIKLTNKTGSNTVAGQLVIASTGTADAFATAGASDTAVIGIVLDASVSDGSEAWVVVSGIADVLIDTGGTALGDRLISSATAGSADVSNSPATAVHFQEIGHCIEARVGAGLARCVLHFN